MTENQIISNNNNQNDYVDIFNIANNVVRNFKTYLTVSVISVILCYIYLSNYSQSYKSNILATENSTINTLVSTYDLDVLNENNFNSYYFLLMFESESKNLNLFLEAGKKLRLSNATIMNIYNSAKVTRQGFSSDFDAKGINVEMISNQNPKLLEDFHKSLIKLIQVRILELLDIGMKSKVEQLEIDNQNILKNNTTLLNLKQKLIQLEIDKGRFFLEENKDLLIQKYKNNIEIARSIGYIKPQIKSIERFTADEIHTLGEAMFNDDTQDTKIKVIELVNKSDFSGMNSSIPIYLYGVELLTLELQKIETVDYSLYFPLQKSEILRLEKMKDPSLQKEIIENNSLINKYNIAIKNIQEIKKSEVFLVNANSADIIITRVWSSNPLITTFFVLLLLNLLTFLILAYLDEKSKREKINP
tara:strand:+ start:1659 stop:2909 length:1251 start_codon:yes stop_codon:yes gene_type:complete